MAAIGLVLSLAACTSASRDAAAPAHRDARPDAAVPDAFTPLVVEPISRPTFPFPGTDNKYHVAFDVQITNATGVPASLTAVDVVDAHDPSRTLVSFSGTDLVDPACSYGGCNRLRLLPAKPAPDSSIPPRASRSLLIDCAFADEAQFPRSGDAAVAWHRRDRPRVQDPEPDRHVGRCVRHIGGPAAGDQPTGAGR
ncbi:hypothetical protein [Mycobacterium spongiae]|uniref:hypothetical protein n=1 Tax=Mycobacterium spongiae TaxID=886343 RepID=UPI001FE3EB7F|nr:hypothetical protein [Mycobacterium spongiae]